MYANICILCVSQIAVLVLMSSNYNLRPDLIFARTVPATPNSETSNSGTGISDPVRGLEASGSLGGPLALPGVPWGALGAPRGSLGPVALLALCGAD